MLKVFKIFITSNIILIIFFIIKINKNVDNKFNIWKKYDKNLDPPILFELYNLQFLNFTNIYIKLVTKITY